MEVQLCQKTLLVLSILGVLGTAVIYITQRDNSCDMVMTTPRRSCEDVKELPKLFWNPEHRCKGASAGYLSNIASSTDATRTFVEIQKTNLKIGDTFKARIFAKNYRNEFKKIGGDFFKVVLLRKSVEGDGVAAKVVDLGDGTYRLEAPLLWEGEVVLQAVLIHPSEAVSALRYKTSEEHGDGFGFKSEVTDKLTNKTEVMHCGPFLKSRKILCNMSGEEQGEHWYCEKPKAGCESLLIYERDRSSEGLKRWRCGFAEYMNSTRNWVVRIGRFDQVFNVSKSTESAEMNPTQKCTYGSRVGGKISGWFIDKKWQSSVCKNKQFSVDFASKCLNNSDVHILGDSTARQFFSFLRRTLKMKQGEPSEVRFQPREAVSKKLNLRLFSTAHGPPLQNPGPFSPRPYLSATFKKIALTDPKRPVKILLSFGLHFLSFRLSYFKQRVSVVKKSILNLLQRLPEARVIVKGINFHYVFDYYLPRPQWLCYRSSRILREELGGIKNVNFIDTWDMTLVQTPSDVHPKDPMISHQMGLILSYLCE